MADAYGPAPGAEAQNGNDAGFGRAVAGRWRFARSVRPGPGARIGTGLAVGLIAGLVAGIASLPSPLAAASAAAAVRALAGAGLAAPALRRMRPPGAGHALDLPRISPPDPTPPPRDGSRGSEADTPPPRAADASPWRAIRPGEASAPAAGPRRAGARPQGLAFARPPGARGASLPAPQPWGAFWRGPGAEAGVVPGRSLAPLLARLSTGPGAEARAVRLREAGLRLMDRHGGALRAASGETGLSLPFLLAMALTESGGDSHAVSPAGALGLMQLMPSVLSDQGVSDPFSAAETAPAAARHFSALLRRFHEDPVAALAAWNAGPEVVARAGGVPDWPETRAFAPRTLAAFAALRVLCAPVPAGPRDACGPAAAFSAGR